MKIRYILEAGAIITALVVTPCSFEKEKNEIAAITATCGQNNKIKLPQLLIINTKEQEKRIVKKIEEVDEYVYTKERVNIRTQANTESTILLTADIGTKLRRIKTNIIQGWDMILINGEKYYIANEYLTLDKPEEEAKSIEEQIKDSYISAKDLRYMSAIIFAEAGNQCDAGKQGVGIVVMNRVKSKDFYNSVYDVIYQKGQFSPVYDGNLNMALKKYDNGTIPKSCIDAAKYALRGETIIYYNDTAYDLKDYLYFSRYVKNCRLKIQDHMFK